jgi:RNA polymerase sigma-70 factor, ECF subfamily
LRIGVPSLGFGAERVPGIAFWRRRRGARGRSFNVRTGRRRLNLARRGDAVLGSGTPTGEGPVPDERLVELAAHGDHDAFTALARERFDRLYGIARMTVRDHGMAEDAVQNALVRIWRDLPTLREHARFDAWSYRLVVNACRDELRRRRRWTASVTPLPDDHDPADVDATDAIAGRDELERAFDTLSADHRAVLALHHQVGLSVEEVADVLDIPVGTAKSRLHYGARALRAALDAGLRTEGVRA